MLFGPPWPQPVSGQRPGGADRQALQAAGEAAEQLLEDLRHGEQLTKAWSNKPLADAIVETALSRCLGRLAATGAWGEANQVPSSELWRIAGTRLQLGWLQHRARFKPLGYAGDHQLLERICRQVCCTDPLGAAFDRYFLRQAAPQAVRNRAEQVAFTLAADCLQRTGGEYRVTSVQCGPAIDVADALAMLPERRRAEVRATLLDLDPSAVDDARRRVEPLATRGMLQCERVNVSRLAHSRVSRALLGTPDLLVCAGLFDYLDDVSAIEMLAFFWDRLAPGGLMLVGNFAPHNATRAYMEWIANWYLVYRTAEELASLAAAAGIPPEQAAITSERQGVDLFLSARKD